MMYVRLILLSILWFGIFNSIIGQEKVRVWEEPLTLPTYVVKAPEKNPMFFNNQSYQGASRYVYPYALEDNITNEKTEKTYKALYLENEYIKLCVLPEIGGRLFYATDKTNGYEIFYRQHVIKPSNIGMLGAWISGGIEFCVFHHHRASTNIPVDYTLEQNEDGSATIWIGETEPRHRMKWTLGISLFPGKSYLEVDGRLINPTENTNSILYWANVATHVNDDYQVFFPPSTDYGVYHAKNSFAHWPVTSNVYNGKEHYKNNIDASWWKNHPDPISIFAHDIKDGFLAGYDHGKDAGTMHVGNPHIVKGAKLWEWGPGAYGSMWDSKVLTDNDGPYAELMTGAYSDNQPDYSWLKPYECKTFKQYWYPLRQTKGAVAANLQAAVNLKKVSNSEFLIAANTTQIEKNVSLVLRKKEEVVFETKKDIAPGNPFYKKIELPNTDESELTISLINKYGMELISYQPIQKEMNPPLPDPVVPPKNTEDIESIEELYITGLRIKQFHNARLSPVPYFEEALKRDPLDIRSNTMMGIISKENFELEKATGYFRSALKRLAANYTRPRDCEPLYHLGTILKQQGKYEAAYDTLYRAAWDQNYASPAYFQLAQISVIKQNYEMALTEVNRSLEYNSSNLSAINLKTSILRLMWEDVEKARELVKLVLEKDPLNFRAINEGVLLEVIDQDEQKKIMRNHPESYLELSNEYLQFGALEDAKVVLVMAGNSEDDFLKNYPSIHYYLGYIYHKEENKTHAEYHFQRGNEASSDYCFPFRYESFEVYKTALKFNPSDSRAYYYLGNLLFDKQPEKAIGYWEKAVALEPELAIAHRNIGWGYNQTNKDLDKAISAYEAAIKHDNREPKFYFELDKLYEENGTSIEKRYKLLTENHEWVSQRPDALLQEIKVLILNGNSKKAIEYLRSNFMPRQEGVDNLHDIYVDACLTQGIFEYNTGSYKEALKYFLMADEYPENHQIGRNDSYQKNAQLYYYQALAFDKLHKSKEAASLFKKVTDLDIKKPEYTFYRALAFQKSDNKKQAELLAKEMEEKGNELLSSAGEVDFFSKFGEEQSAKIRQGQGNYLLGLTELIKGNKKEAKHYFESSLQLNPNNVWAKTNLENFKSF